MRFAVLLAVALLGCGPSKSTTDTTTTPPPAEPTPPADPGAGSGSATPAEPADCFCTMQYDPVCGSDGKTYGNACQAGCAKVSVASPGECPK